MKKGRGRPRTPPQWKGRRSGPSGASNVSSEEEGGRRGGSPIPEEESLPANTGICTAVVRATNPYDGQTAIHRAAVAGRHENVTELLRADPECATARDRKGDTALHLACSGTQKKTHRKTVEALLACDKAIANVRNSRGGLPEDECPHSKTRKLVIKRRTKEMLDLPPVPTHNPGKVLSQFSVGGSSTSSEPLTQSRFEDRMQALKNEVRSKSSTSDQDTSN
jgi:hypothetical protein